MKSLALILLSPALFAQTPTEKMLLERIAALEARIAALEARSTPAPTPAVPAPTPAVPAPVAAEAPPPLPRATTLNLYLDGYYAFNGNRPLSRENQLRAFDVSHNSFTLSQATLMLERTTSLADKRYLGGRVDLQFGQATNTLQGSIANEPRPAIYRNIFQAYGSVLAPVGKGLSVDFGKFASSLGLETNYAKDQFNYSRSYFFNFLPFYHMGMRATYPIHSRMSATYWLVNGANQTEDFNSAKSQAAILSFTPSSQISGNFNYFVGGENTGPRTGRFHVLDTWWNWNLSSRLSLAGELDYVVNRSLPQDAPRRVTGAVAYARYRLSPRWNIATRFTALNDKGGLFGGQTQNLREFTFTTTYDLPSGFQMRWEFRRDMSSHPFFATSREGVLSRSMNTGLIGLTWWMGGKQGAW